MFPPSLRKHLLICLVAFAHLQKPQSHQHRRRPMPELLYQRGMSSDHVIVRCGFILVNPSRVGIENYYFAMILPGSATLNVHCRPPPGLKTALGLEVSTVIPFDVPLRSCLSFRFCLSVLAFWQSMVSACTNFLLFRHPTVPLSGACVLLAQCTLKWLSVVRHTAVGFCRSTYRRQKMI